MKRNLRIIAFCGAGAVLLLGIIFGVMIFGKRASKQPEQEKKTFAKAEEANPSDRQQVEETKKTKEPKKSKKLEILDIRAVKDKAGDLGFSISIDDFINCYNGYYRRDNGVDYIQPASEWNVYEQDYGKYKGDMHYEFKADKKMWTLPTITVYTPEHEKTIRALTVDFDDHSFTDIMYEQYEELCFYTLKVFFPKLNKQKIIKLYKDINQSAYKNIFQKGQGFHSGTPPHDLYYQNETGVYPYFAYGECVRLCVIPVTPKVIRDYKEKGTLIHQM